MFSHYYYYFHYTEKLFLLFFFKHCKMMHQDLPIEHSKAVDPKQDETEEMRE